MDYGTEKIAGSVSEGPLPCQVCDPGTTPSEMQIEFLAGAANAYGTGCATCSDWERAWILPKFSVAKVESLFSTYPTAMPAMFGTYTPSYNACWYGLSSGLPCGAVEMILFIYDSGSLSGVADLQVGIIWSDGVHVRIDIQITIASGGNCVLNLTQDSPNPPIVSYTGTVAVSDQYVFPRPGPNYPPCDFYYVFYSDPPNQKIYWKAIA